MIDCILACPEHGDLYRVERVPVPNREGSFMHRIVQIADGVPVASAKTCPQCEEPLKRKEPQDAA